MAAMPAAAQTDIDLFGPHDAPPDFGLEARLARVDAERDETLREFRAKLASAQDEVPATDEPHGWEFELTPYLMFAQLQGTQRIGNTEVPLDFSFSDLIDNADFLFSMRFAATKDRFGILVDGLYLSLAGESTLPPSIGVKSGVEQFMGELDAVWAIDDRRYLWLLGGVRYTYQKSDISLSGPGPGVSRDASENWVDPVLGAILRVPLGEKWSFSWRLDFGGFQSNSKSWQTIAGLRWRPTRLISVTAGYRVLDQKYVVSDWAYDAQISGGFVGLGFHF